MEAILYGMAGLGFLYVAYFIIVLFTMDPPDFDDYYDEDI